MAQGRRQSLILAAILLVTVLVGTPRADNLSGAWTMVKYEGPAAHGTATGQLVLSGNRFDLIYIMDEGGQRSGRAHAGTYDVKGDQLTYHVAWSFQYVSGEGSVAAKPQDRTTTFVLKGDTLTVTFANNGGVQTFMRAK